MKSILLNLNKSALCIYILFFFDSLLKLDFGIQVHIGIVAIIILNCIVLIDNPRSIIKACIKDYFFLIFVCYALLNGMVFWQPGFTSIATYLFISTNVFIYCSYTFKLMDSKAFYYFQIILIVTGMFQYGLYKLSGYQLSFIDAEHYQKGSSVSYRLRGFFIEPNWFAISLTFNTFILIGKDIERSFRLYPKLLLLTAVVLILNGTLTTVGILVLVYSIPYIKKEPLKGFLLAIVLLGMLTAVFGFRDSINQKQGQALLNHSSRIEPLVRVIDYQNNENIVSIIFGHGLGSWGTLAVDNRLSVLVFDPKENARDGSEIPVIIFELGMLGIVILFLDSFFLYLKCGKDDFYLKGGVVLFVACFALYPTLKFWMYMPYYFYIRSAITHGK